MSNLILMTKPLVSISLDQANNLVVAKWSGFLRLEEVREGCEFMTQCFKDYPHIRIHLSEHRALKVLSTEVQDYLVKEWFVEVEKIGVRKIGVIVSDDVFAEASVVKVNREASRGQLRIEMFLSEEECVRWLLDQ